MSRMTSLALALFIILAPAALACDLAATIAATPAPSVCNGVYPMLNASVTGGDGNYSYQWFHYAWPIDGATASSYQTTAHGYYWVDVTDGNGCVVRSNVVNLPVENPSAAITLSPVCIGGTTSAQVPDAGSGAAYSWSVTNGTITWSSAGSFIYFTPTASPVTVEATVTMPSGCSVTGSRTETAGVQPSIEITASGPTTFCHGGSVTLTANVTNAESFSWNTGATTPSITVSNEGYYTVTATNGECTAYESVYVNAIRSSSQITSGGGTICAGASRTIATSLTGQGPWTLTWSDGFTETVGLDGHTQLTVYRIVTPTASTNYTITALDDASSCAATMGGSANITVAQPPTATVSGNNQICPGGAAPVRVDLTGQAPWTVTWSDGVTQNASQTPLIRSVSPAATRTYTVTSIRDNYCSAGTSSGSATITVAPPTATVSGGGAICPGGSATVQAALTGKGPWIVTWADGPTISYASSPAVRTVSPSSTTTYSVYSVADANCTGTASGSATVTVQSTPSAVVSGDATICAGGSATINVALTGTAPFTILWSDGVTTSSGTRTVSPASTTTYSVTSVADAHCTGTASGSATITVDALPSITTQPQSQTIRKNTTATLTVAATSPRPMTYQWYRGAAGDTSTPVGTNSTTYTTPKLSATTQYWVRVSSSCGATNSATATITVR